MGKGRDKRKRQKAKRTPQEQPGKQPLSLESKDSRPPTVENELRRKTA